ncbi:17916_t:CDS:2, partial [Funneliformis geosporum]
KSILSISDLGLCKPVEYFQSSKNNDIYGVLPFVAPEVLRGQPYSFASDIYSFSMIMWEFISGVSPFYNEAYDFQLALNICKDKRPEIIKDILQCYIDLMKRCKPNCTSTTDSVINVPPEYNTNKTTNELAAGDCTLQSDVWPYYEDEEPIIFPNGLLFGIFDEERIRSSRQTKDSVK